MAKDRNILVMPCGDEFASSIGRDGGTVKQSEREIHGVLIAYPDRRSTSSPEASRLLLDV